MKRSFVCVASLVLLSFSCTGEGSDKPLRSGARRDALSSGMVISEVYGGGGSASSAYRYDFVELFNRGTTAIDVSNWSVQYASDTGGGWQVSTLGAYGLVQPGSHLLVRMGTMGSGGATLPTHDATGGSTMSATSGKVALVNSSTGLTGTCPAATAYVDLVGYGATANCSEGSSPTLSTSTTTSARRSANGCTETDVNSQDFTVGTPTPKNSGATSVVCTGGTGGSDAGCTTVAMWPTATSRGGYDAPTQTSYAELRTSVGTDGGLDLLAVEVYFGAGLMVPSSATFTAASTYGGCELCVLMSRGCDGTGLCSQDFFAQGGTVSVSAASQSANGQLVGTLTNVRLEEWDAVNDQPIPGGECVIVTSQAVNVSWTGGGSGATGGGAGATGGGSASTGGGSASGGGSATGGGSGETDGGTLADAGTGGGNGKLGGQTSCGCTSGGDVLSVLFGGLLLLARRARRCRELHPHRRPRPAG